MIDCSMDGGAPYVAEGAREGIRTEKAMEVTPHSILRRRRRRRRQSQGVFGTGPRGACERGRVTFFLRVKRLSQRITPPAGFQ